MIILLIIKAPPPLQLPADSVDMLNVAISSLLNKKIASPKNAHQANPAPEQNVVSMVASLRRLTLVCPSNYRLITIVKEIGIGRGCISKSESHSVYEYR